MGGKPKQVLNVALELLRRQSLILPSLIFAQFFSLRLSVGDPNPPVATGSSWDD